MSFSYYNSSCLLTVPNICSFFLQDSKVDKLKVRKKKTPHRHQKKKKSLANRKPLNIVFITRGRTKNILSWFCGIWVPFFSGLGIQDRTCFPIFFKVAITKPAHAHQTFLLKHPLRQKNLELWDPQLPASREM